jgi:GT2 family glycosyltransferase/uncharacterized coiled-coil DUF342 family protein
MNQAKRPKLQRERPISGISKLPDTMESVPVSEPATHMLEQFLPGCSSGFELEHPSRLVHPTAWVGHIPFAFWLVEAFRPRTLVELGVHSGNSYCAFLQAVHTLALKTQCFGVDHWKGDDHAGLYGEEVYRELSAYHNPLYGAFSTLLRSSFDEALQYFSDGTIDLLHVDGCHTYDAISHDFSCWRAKMSSRGVVLFHDVNVRERHFGVWKFWEELVLQFPTFNFIHSHGLGVAYVGCEKLSGPLHALFDSDPSKIRAYFSRLGTSVVERHELQDLRLQFSKLATHRRTLEEELASRDAKLATLNATLEAARAEAREELIGQANRLRDELSASDSARHELSTHVNKLGEELLRSNSAREELSTQVNKLGEELSRSNSARDELSTQVNKLGEELSRSNSTRQVLAARLASLQGELSNGASVRQALVEMVNSLQNEISAGIAARQALVEQVNSLRNEQSASISARQALADEVNNLKRELSASLSSRQELLEQVNRLRSELSASVSNAEILATELAGVLHSRSWRATRYIRVLAERYPSLRRAIKLTWWTLSLQLNQRIRDYRRYRKQLTSGAQIAATNSGSRRDLASADQAQAWQSHVPAAASSDVCPLPVTSSQVVALVDSRIRTNPQTTADPRGSSHPQLSSGEPLSHDDEVLDPKTRFTEGATHDLLGFLSSGKRLTFRQAPTPDVSVLIILWNQAHLTLRCLRKLHTELQNYADLSMEIVLVDNASSDQTSTLLSRIDGIRVLRNTSNVGFLVACNQAAAAASGRALLLLNNDAFVRPGAITAAMATLEEQADVGAVGGRLILPSGQLQEAGSIVWSDGSTLGYGRGLDPEAAEVMFRRDVDYCSGAFFMTRRALWEQLGGFDEVYRPAYYEEADYCMRLREAGFRVVFDPRVAVDHYEFGSEVKKGDSHVAMVRNRNLFYDRHAKILQKWHLPPIFENILSARERAAVDRWRILVMDNEVPLSAFGGGYPRARDLLKEIVAAGWLVSFFPMHRAGVDWGAARAEIPYDVEICSWLDAPRLAEFLRSRRGHYDVVLVSRPDNMAILQAILWEEPRLLEGVRLIYDAEALFCARTITQAACEGAPLAEKDAEALIAKEIALTRGTEAISCVSQAEAQVFQARQSAPVHVLSHSVKVRSDAPGFNERAGFLFVGRLLEREAPNWRGLAWFTKHVWPLIISVLPEATLTVVGHLHPDNEELQHYGVRLLGPADYLDQLYDSARVFVAPTRFAAGVSIKVLEATGAGLPTVTTHLIARQLGWKPAKEILAEDEPAAMAAAAILLHRDRRCWTNIRSAAHQRVAREHSPAIFRAGVRALLDGMKGTAAVSRMAAE